VTVRLFKSGPIAAPTEVARFTKAVQSIEALRFEAELFEEERSFGAERLFEGEQLAPVIPAVAIVTPIIKIAAEAPTTVVAAQLSCEAGPLSEAEPRSEEARMCPTIAVVARAFPIIVVADVVDKPPFDESSVKLAG
jgi:hypothetical protein